MDIRNATLKCKACGFAASEFVWDEVWSHKEGGFVASSCPECHAFGQARYFGLAPEPSEVSLYGLEKILHTLTRLNREWIVQYKRGCEWYVSVSTRDLLEAVICLCKGRKTNPESVYRLISRPLTAAEEPYHVTRGRVTRW